VLEEEATSTEPIPDALLPSVVDFIQASSISNMFVSHLDFTGIIFIRIKVVLVSKIVEIKIPEMPILEKF
jgi:hypothetical protein